MSYRCTILRTTKVLDHVLNAHRPCALRPKSPDVNLALFSIRTNGYTGSKQYHLCYNLVLSMSSLVPIGSTLRVAQSLCSTLRYTYVNVLTTQTIE